jgi:hypothetical protein
MGTGGDGLDRVPVACYREIAAGARAAEARWPAHLFLLPSMSGSSAVMSPKRGRKAMSR